jgi:hypothetical protein
MAWTRAALALAVAGAVALAVVSGGSSADPRTPRGLPGLPPPFLGTAVVGDGGLTAAVDAYGDVVDLRAPGPAGRALIENPAARQAAGTVAADTGIVPRVRVGGEMLPLWRADSVSQHYLVGTNVVRTMARFGRERATVLVAAADRRLAIMVRMRRGDRRQSAGGRQAAAVGVDTTGASCRSAIEGGALGLICMPSAVPLSPRFLASQPPGIALAVRRGRSPFVAATRAIIARAAASDRAWLARASPLGGGTPAWARGMYRRSLLTLRALTDRRTGAVAAGARDGWAYVWPRDAATAALAYAAAGYRPEARRVAEFLEALDLDAAARFDGDGAPVPGREAQGDMSGWVTTAARAARIDIRAATPAGISSPWRDSPDYQEGAPGDYLANALAAAKTTVNGGGIARAFGGPKGLFRRAGDPGSGLDSAAAWAVRPFPLPELFPAVHRTLLRLASDRTRFGITPGEGWSGTDPWTAPTAWSAWGLAALSDWARSIGDPAPARRDRRAALSLLADLRRAATPAGALPERVDARTGIPRSTTPLAWSHAFAVLTLRELWPDRPAASAP